MSEFNTLSTMGLTEIDQISRFTVTEKTVLDVLKVHFDRPENSVLPRSASFSFYHDDIEQQQTKIAAIAELTQLTKNSEGNKEVLEQLEADLDRMEAIMKSKLDEMRQELNNLF